MCFVCVFWFKIWFVRLVRYWESLVEEFFLSVFVVFLVCDWSCVMVLVIIFSSFRVIFLVGVGVFGVLKICIIISINCCSRSLVDG